MAVHKVADEVANMVVDMQVDKVTDIVVDITDVTMTIGDSSGDGVIEHVGWKGGRHAGGYGG